MEYDVEILKLSSKFVVDYPHNKYPELMSKSSRPYSCLLIDTHEDYFICVPFRSSIEHNNAYLFRNTRRSMAHRSGLDYSKIVLIKDSSYIDTAGAIVDQDEYKEAMTNMSRIAADAVRYVDDYIAHVTGERVLHHRAYNRRYRFSTLPYFHEIMGII